MAKKQINFNKSCKPTMLGYIIFFVVGILIATIWGVSLDINFKGGTILTYSYEGKISTEKFESVVKDTIKNSFTVDKSKSIAGDTETISIRLVGSNALSAAKQKALNKALDEKFTDNKLQLYNSNSVSPNIAGTFFIKSLVAVLISAILVVIYVGFRFRQIGGISAGIAALISLLFDILTTFFICVIFRLEVDANYIAVVVTILGYSLNDTIVIFDRVRENRKLYPESTTYDLVNDSINMVFMRTLVTSIATFVAVVTIVAVSELYGLTTLRTFGIPMAFGVISGSLSTITIAGPLWVQWQQHKQKKLAAKA